VDVDCIGVYRDLGEEFMEETKKPWISRAEGLLEKSGACAQFSEMKKTQM
jgi:hypothetical protein